MDAYKAYKEKAKVQSYKNAKSHIEQILEVTPLKSAAVRSHTSHHTGHCWGSKGELVSGVLLWTPSHGGAGVGRLARTYLQQLSTDTGCSLEDLPHAMDYRDEWRGRVREICACSTTWWWYIQKPFRIWTRVELKKKLFYPNGRSTKKGDG